MGFKKASMAGKKKMGMEDQMMPDMPSEKPMMKPMMDEEDDMPKKKGKGGFAVMIHIGRGK